MELVVDLHIHSHYSRATSRQMNTQDLYRWGKIKGINIIGTGDFTHPKYFAELCEKLEPAEPGLFTLKKEYAETIDAELPKSVKDNLIRFVLTVEISNIYSKGGKVRKLHNVIIVPDFETAAEINNQL
ncbi:DNA helicase UvrD, partial [Candidatus Dojkabacteria bacterium]|nr:DNA helicase UvrD [Candidatus Dojkabacteria bacterium]